MKKKISHYLLGLSTAVVIIAVISVTFIFYGLFQRQVRADLRTDAELIRAAGITYPCERPEDKNTDIQNLRVTWIDQDGRVLYDSDVDASLLENHAGRPEVALAMQSGEGESRRRSDTLGKDTFYYAVLLDDSSILRLAVEASSIFGIFLKVLPVIILIVLIIILLSAVTAYILTGQLLKPIDKIAQNMEDAPDETVYEELLPFVDTIREQHENILSAARSRQDFTANVSHELKTPLTAISGYAELIENHMVDPDQESLFAGKIRENADRLVSLINDIIRLSELDSAADVELGFEEIDLYETALSRVELLQVSALQKNITFSVKGEPTLMRGNKSMIIELIDNLCQNAVRYNVENGEVRVFVYREGERPVFMVSDNGIGIPKDLQERVFERFFRVDKSRSRETGGTGLGLAIVKHIVELHDAEITLESEVGEGTTIKVKF